MIWLASFAHSADARRSAYNAGFFSPNLGDEK